MLAGTGCVCVDGYYDTATGLLVCYDSGADWSTSDFRVHDLNAPVPQCLPCGDCLKCKSGSATVAKGFMVSEAGKSIVPRSTSACGCSAPSTSLVLVYPSIVLRVLGAGQWPGRTPGGVRVPARGVRRKPGLQRDTARRGYASLCSPSTLVIVCGPSLAHPRIVDPFVRVTRPVVLGDVDPS